MIRNQGSSLLTISAISVSCGCSGAQLDRNDIPPGESTNLKIGIKDLGIGPRTVSISLTSNDPLNPVSLIELKWNAISPIDADPQSVDLGNLEAEEIREFPIKVFLRSGLRSSKISSARLDSHELSWKSPLPEFPYPLTNTPLLSQVVVTAGVAFGDRFSSITFEIPDSPQKHLTIPVRWKVVPVVQVTPSSLFLRGEKPVRLVLSTHRTEGLMIDSVQFDEKVLVVTTAKNSQLYEVRLKEPGDDSGETEIQMNLSQPKKMVLKIPVAWYHN